MSRPVCCRIDSPGGEGPGWSDACGLEHRRVLDDHPPEREDAPPLPPRPACSSPPRSIQHSGYRYYSTAQVPAAQVIRRLRDLGMPVREVGEVVGSADPAARSAVIAGHLARLEDQLDADHGQPSPSLRRLLEPAEPADRGGAPVGSRAGGSRDPRRRCEHAEVLEWYGDAMAELDARWRPRTTATGPPAACTTTSCSPPSAVHAVVYRARRRCRRRSAAGCARSSCRPPTW